MQDPAQKSYGPTSYVARIDQKPYAERMAAAREGYGRMLDKIGSVGAGLASAFAQTGCGEEVVPAGPGWSACYLSYESPEGYINRLYVQPETLDDPVLFFSHVNHERIHAIQSSLAPALHAHSLNPVSPVQVCPEDVVWLAEAIEHDAYAKQAMFDYLLLKTHPHLADEVRRKNGAVHAYEIAEENKMPFFQAVLGVGENEMARQIKGASLFARAFGTASARHRIHEIGLGNARLFLENDREKTRTLVRLDEQDKLDVGRALGFNSLGERGGLHPLRERAPALGRMQSLRLAFLNMRHGRAAPENLPTLSEGLAMHGMGKEDFLLLSRTPPAL